MSNQPIFIFIKKLQRPIFTTHELSSLSGKSLSATTQALNFLQKQGLISRIYRGIWLETMNKNISPYTVIPFLFPRQRAYVSFISALHLYGIIEQIPQVIDLASMVHTKKVHTKIADFFVHQIAPSFFDGFMWYKGEGSFLIAEPEKALADCLYLSGRKKKQFGYFPELSFPKSFSFAKAKKWIKKIPEANIAGYAEKKLEEIIKINSLAKYGGM
jgi:predicted transcriptional regulator of viral defense system